MDHEGQFRGAMWKEFERLCRPEPGDWVLAIDADEFLVDIEGRHDAGPGGVLGTLRGTCAANFTHTAIRLPIPEVFGWSGERPLVRKDGYWGAITGNRLFRHQADGVFANKDMGCGSEPTYVAGSSISRQNFGLNLLHFGYAHEGDRNEKYARYSKRQGHNPAHINSILQQPILELWPGQVPEIWRGVRNDR
jgi:hypothetical protein